MKKIIFLFLIFVLSTNITCGKENPEYNDVSMLVKSFIEETGNNTLGGTINFKKYCHPDFFYPGSDRPGPVVSEKFNIESIKKEKGKYNIIHPDIEEELISVTVSFKILGSFTYGENFNFQQQEKIIKSIYYFSKSTGKYLILFIKGPVEIIYYPAAIKWSEKKAGENPKFSTVLESLKKVKGE